MFNLFYINIYTLYRLKASIKKDFSKDDNVLFKQLTIDISQNFSNTTFNFYLICVSIIMNFISVSINFFFNFQKLYKFTLFFSVVVFFLSLFNITNQYSLLVNDINEINNFCDNKNKKSKLNMDAEKIISKTIENINENIVKMFNISSNFLVKLNDKYSDPLLFIKSYAENISIKPKEDSNKFINFDYFYQNFKLKDIFEENIKIKKKYNLSEKIIKEHILLINQNKQEIEKILKEINLTKKFKDVSFEDFCNVFVFINSIQNIEQFIENINLNKELIEKINSFFKTIGFDNIENFKNFLNQNKIDINNFVPFMLLSLNDETDEKILIIKNLTKNILSIGLDQKIEDKEMIIFLKNLKKELGNNMGDTFEDLLNKYSVSKEIYDSLIVSLNSIFESNNLNDIKNILNKKKINNITDFNNYFINNIKILNNYKKILTGKLEILNLKSTEELQNIIYFIYDFIEKNKIKNNNIKEINSFFISKTKLNNQILKKIEYLLKFSNSKSFNELNILLLKYNDFLKLFNLNNPNTLVEKIKDYEEKIKLYDEVKIIIENIFNEKCNDDNLIQKITLLIQTLNQNNVYINNDLYNYFKNLENNYFIKENLKKLQTVFNIQKSEDLIIIFEKLIKIANKYEIKVYIKMKDFLKKIIENKQIINSQIDNIMSGFEKKISISDLIKILQSLNEKIILNLDNTMAFFELSEANIKNDNKIIDYINSIKNEFKLNDFKLQDTYDVFKILTFYQNWNVYIKNIYDYKIKINSYFNKLLKNINCNTLDGIYFIFETAKNKNKDLSEYLNENLIDKDFYNILNKIVNMVNNLGFQSDIYNIFNNIVILNEKLFKFNLNLNENSELVNNQIIINKIKADFDFENFEKIKTYISREFKNNDILYVIDSIKKYEINSKQNILDYFKSLLKEINKATENLYNFKLINSFEIKETKNACDNFLKFQDNINLLISEEIKNKLDINNIDDLIFFLENILSIKDFKLSDSCNILHFLKNKENDSMLPTIYVYNQYIKNTQLMNEIYQNLEIINDEIKKSEFNIKWNDFIYNHPKEKIIKSFYTNVLNIIENNIRIIEIDKIYNENIDSNLCLLYSIYFKTLGLFIFTLQDIKNTIKNTQFSKIDHTKIINNIFLLLSIDKYLYSYNFIFHAIEGKKTINTKFLQSLKKNLKYSNTITFKEILKKYENDNNYIAYNLNNFYIVFNKILNNIIFINKNNEFFVTVYGKVTVEPNSKILIDEDGSVRLIILNFSINLQGLEKSNIKISNNKLKIEFNKGNKFDIFLDEKTIAFTKNKGNYISMIKDCNTNNTFVVNIYKDFKNFNKKKGAIEIKFIDFDYVYIPSSLINNNQVFIVKINNRFIKLYGNIINDSIKYVDNKILFNNKYFELNDEINLDSK